MGVAIAVLSAVLASAKDVISKRLSFHLDGMASTFASFAFALPFYVFVLMVLYVLGHEVLIFSLSFLTLVLLRSLTDTMAEGMKMHSFAHGDISVVASFFSLSPLFLLIVSPLITGDIPSLPGTVAVILVVVGGTLLIYRPSSKSWAAQKKGILLATGAALFFSLNSCFDRLAVQEGTPVFAGFTMTLLSCIFLLPWILNSQRRESLGRHKRELWLRGFLEIAFMVSKLYALQYLQAPYVVGLQRISVLISIISGRVFFREEDFGRRLLAGVLILGGVLLIVWMEW